MLLTLPFHFAPDGQILGILSATLMNLAYALILCMTTVYFLNNDYLEHRPASPAPPQEPASS
jgi:hypothetical protein